MQCWKQENLLSIQSMNWLWSLNFVYERKPIATCKKRGNSKICPFNTSIQSLLCETSQWIYLICCFVFTAEPLFRSPCELLPVGLGHPVQAKQKSFTALAGCASKGTISLPHEVHIVNLRGHEAEGARNTLPEVSELKLSYRFYDLISHLCKKMENVDSLWQRLKREKP